MTQPKCSKALFNAKPKKSHLRIGTQLGHTKIFCPSLFFSTFLGVFPTFVIFRPCVYPCDNATLNLAPKTGLGFNSPIPLII